jgi:hypothetical protein
MAQKSYNNLYTGITSTIKNNSLKSISGITLQNALIDIVDSTFGAFSGNTGGNNKTATGITTTYVDSSSVVSEVTVKSKILEIGDWDMDTNDSKSVASGISSLETKLRLVSIMVRNDSATELNPFLCTIRQIAGGSLYEGEGGINISTDDLIYLRRKTAGIYDSTEYNSTSYNRGWIYITYQE